MSFQAIGGSGGGSPANYDYRNTYDKCSIDPFSIETSPFQREEKSLAQAILGTELYNLAKEIFGGNDQNQNKQESNKNTQTGPETQAGGSGNQPPKNPDITSNDLMPYPEDPAERLRDMQSNPPRHPDYTAPKRGGANKVRNPNGPGSGWPDKKGNVWVPTDHKGTHAPHWDVQHRDGTHTTIYPDMCERATE